MRCLAGAADAAERMVVMGDHPGALVEALAERFPGAIRVMATSALDLSLAGQLPPGVQARVSVSVDPPAPGSADLCVIHVSGFEGKDRLRARIALARDALRPGGELYVMTHARRGAESNLAALREVLGEAEVVGRGGGGVRILRGVRRVDDVDSDGSGGSGGEGEAARGGEQVIEAEVLGERFVFRTGESVFSRGRLDLGTRFFLERLDVGGATRLLDIGCGYGPIGIVLARVHPALAVTMVDVEVEAVRFAAANAVENGVAERARVVLSDGLRAIRGETFDLVVTHFPLHIPRPKLQEILTDARDALAPGGRLCGVALNAYDVRPTVQRVFGNVDTLAESDPREYGNAFRVVCARRTAP
ncbi:MAG TPA: methyltransferase [Longimicrobium sp.]|nr:methyltransferase [Longimicrobium sp.]